MNNIIFTKVKLMYFSYINRRTATKKVDMTKKMNTATIMKRKKDPKVRILNEIFRFLIVIKIN